MMRPAPTVPVVTLSPDLARRLRLAAKKVQDGTEERNQLIREAAEGGASLREIAAAVGLDHTGVRKIIIKGSPK
jgi:hypothetical protein